PLKDEQCLEQTREVWQTHKLDGLIVVGGEGSLSAARDLCDIHQFQIVGVPKTIDNDICGTDFTFGFDTAVSIVTDAIDRLHSTETAVSKPKRSEEHTSELQSRGHLVCRLLLEKKKT